MGDKCRHDTAVEQARVKRATSSCAAALQRWLPDALELTIARANLLIVNAGRSARCGARDDPSRPDLRSAHRSTSLDAVPDGARNEVRSGEPLLHIDR